MTERKLRLLGGEVIDFWAPMRGLVSSRSARDADVAAVAKWGYEPWLLMEHAGASLFRAYLRLRKKHESANSVTFLAGSGNNGGDSWVLARLVFLATREALAVVEVSPPTTPECKRAKELAQRAGVSWYSLESSDGLGWLKQSEIWVDGVWGSGLNRPLAGSSKAQLDLLARVRESQRKTTISIDAPSGLWPGWVAGEPFLAANFTLVPGPPKDWFYFPEFRVSFGRIVSCSIPYPENPVEVAQRIEASDLSSLLTPLPFSAHKGTRGHTLVFAGSAGMSGAAVLSARAAAAAGAGLVTVVTSPDLVSQIAPQVPAFMVKDEGARHEILDRGSAAIVGPGWGCSRERTELFDELWASSLPLVVDADGLYHWHLDSRKKRSAPTILTPHLGEVRRFLFEDGPLVPQARRFAEAHGLTLVLKGVTTWVLGPDGSAVVWDGANPALGTGGSGDSLAGLIGGLLASGMGAPGAASAGVILHGRAGRRLAQQEGWFVADALASEIARLSYACRRPQGKV